MWRLPEYVDDANDDPEFLSDLRHLAKRHRVPPFSLIRLLGEVVLGLLFGYLILTVVPEEWYLRTRFYYLYYVILATTPFGIALGKQLNTFVPGCTEWLRFYRRHLQMHFVERKMCISNEIRLDNKSKLVQQELIKTSHYWAHKSTKATVRWHRQQSSWGQHGVHLGPVGPRWAPCWPHEPCYQGDSAHRWDQDLYSLMNKSLTTRSHEVSKPRESRLDFSNRLEIGHSHWQQRCWTAACQTSEPVSRLPEIWRQLQC